MQENRPPESNKPKRIRWKEAFLAGLICGIIFLIVVRGLPWFSSGLISPGVMGRELPNSSPDHPARLAMAAALLHIIVSVLYAIIVAPVVHRLRIKPAIGCGALIGFGLYVINYFIFVLIYPQYSGQQELAPIFTHIIFGMAAAGAYKGLAEKRRVRSAA